MNHLGSERRRLAVVALCAVLALGVTACGDDDNGSTDESGAPSTTVVTGDLVLGSGQIPSGFPEDFPIPEVATIGSTLFDPNRGRYELILLLPSEREAAVVFFQSNLPNAGYEITSNQEEGAAWRIGFASDDAEGTVAIRLTNTGATTATIDLTTG